MKEMLSRRPELQEIRREREEIKEENNNKIMHSNYTWNNDKFQRK